MRIAAPTTDSTGYAAAGAAIRQFVVDELSPTGYAQVVEERDPDGVLKASYDYGLEPLSQWQAGQTPAVTHYLLDAHSGVRVLTDAAGTVTDTIRYDAFGVQVAGSVGVVNPLRYRAAALPRRALRRGGRPVLPASEDL